MKIQKAWVINTSNFSQPWHADHLLYYADKRSEARSEALRDVDGLKDKQDDEITLLSLNMIRAKHLDKTMVNGVWKTNIDIEQDRLRKERNDRCDRLVADNHGALAYIRKGGWYYRPNSCGYTERQIEAGIYTVEQAAAEVKGCDLRDCMDMILIDSAKHNAIIISEIEILKKQLI